MKYLKYFESTDLSNYDGLTPELVEDMFVDILDMGFSVKSMFHEKMVLLSSNSEGMEIASIPNILIHIQGTGDLKSLNVSSEMSEILSVCNDRLTDYGWFVSENIIHSNSIKISLLRKKDDKYIKPTINLVKK